VSFENNTSILSRYRMCLSLSLFLSLSFSIGLSEEYFMSGPSRDCVHVTERKTERERERGREGGRERKRERERERRGCICGIAISTFPLPGTVSTSLLQLQPAFHIYLSFSPFLRSHIFGHTTSHYNAVAFSCETGNRKKSRFIAGFSSFSRQLLANFLLYIYIFSIYQFATTC